MTDGAETDGAFLLCAVLRMPADGLTAFQAFEDAVLALLPDHGAVLERRLRATDGLTEMHVIRFPSATALNAFRADPRRQAAIPLFTASRTSAESWIVADVV